MTTTTQYNRAKWAPLRAQIIALAVTEAPPQSVAAFNTQESPNKIDLQESPNEIDLPDALLDLLIKYAETADGETSPQNHLPILTNELPKWHLLLAHTIQDLTDMEYPSEQQQDVSHFIQDCLFPLMINIFYIGPHRAVAVAFRPASGSSSRDSHDP